MPHEIDCTGEYAVKTLILATIIIFVVAGPVLYVHNNYTLHNSTIASYIFGMDIIIIDDMESRYNDQIDSSNVYEIIDIYSRYTPAGYVDYCSANYPDLTDAEWHCLSLLIREHIVTLRGLVAAGIPEEILQTKL